MSSRIYKRIADKLRSPSSQEHIDNTQAYLDEKGIGIPSKQITDTSKIAI